MKKAIIICGLLVLGIILISGCNEQQDQQPVYTDVTAMEAKELVDTKPDLIIIDVSPNYDDGTYQAL